LVLDLDATTCKPHTPTSLTIGFDADNHPILPSWDDDEGMPLSEIKTLLQTYLDAAWGKFKLILLI
jgi:hypothetical protein